MKRKNIIAIALVLLVIGLFIGIILLSSDPSSVPPTTPTPPSPPGHKHKWQSTHNSTEHWWYCHDIEAHAEDAIKDKDKHKFVVDTNDPSKEKCSVCGYSRPVPTKQEDLVVDFDENGNASIGGLNDDTEEPLHDLVIPGTATDKNGNDVTIEEVKEDAFENNNNLHSLVILEGLKIIGKGAFAHCSELKEIRLPSSVEYIDPEAFSYCNKLEKIIVDGANTVYRSYQNCLILIEEQKIILGCKGSIIPTANESGKYVATKIGEYAFCGSGIGEIVIPTNITSIYAHAFRDCTSLTEFTYPESVTQISDYTFNGCTALKTIKLHDGITKIGEKAFYGCISLVESVKDEGKITLPANLEIIGQSAFNGCSSLKEIELNDDLKGIGDSAFNGCILLDGIVLPANIMAIGNGTFKGCESLTGINIPASVTSVGNSAFEGCILLDGIVLPEKLKALGNNAFKGCESLTGINIPSTVTSIGNSAFEGCILLEEIVLPEKLEKIGNSAFKGCEGLTSIVYKGTPEKWADVITGDNWKPEGVEVTFDPQPDASGSSDEENQD